MANEFGRSGYERRDTVEKRGRTVAQPAGIPMSPLMTPRPASMKDVGSADRELAAILKGVNLGFQEYVEKSKEKWALEGSLAYTEGQTEEEILKSGNRYTTAGFMSMKARTAANEWFTQALVDIDGSDKQLDSKSYQKKLIDSYGSLSKDIGGKDTFTRSLMSSIALEKMPQLVQKQIVSNNEWRKAETKRSAVQLIDSELRNANLPTATDDDRATALELFNMPISGLDYEDDMEIKRNALSNAIKLDNQFVVGMLRDQGKANPNVKSFSAPALLNFISSNEAGSRGYDAVVGEPNSDVTPSTMTLGEIKKWQKERKAAGLGTPVGAYQIKLETLEETQAKLGLSDDVLFTPDTQDTLGHALLQRRGLDEFLAGNMSKEEFGALLSQEWAALPQDASNTSFYEGVNGNHALTDWNSLMDVLQFAPEHADTHAGLETMGFSAADMVQFKNDLTAHTERKTREFSATRVNAENAIVQLATTTGNREAVLQEIQRVKEENGYSDSWADSAMTSANAGLTKFREAAEKEAKLLNMLNTDTLSMGSQQEQAEAFKMLRTSLAQKVGDNPNAEQIVRQNILAVSVRNRVVDPETQAYYRTSLSTPFDKEGNLTNEAAQSYSELVSMYRENVSLTNDYLGENKELFYEALKNDIGYMGTPSAIKAAATTIQKIEDGWVPPKLNTADRAKYVEKEIKERQVGLWSKILPTRSKDNASDRSWTFFGHNREINASEWKAISNDSLLQKAIDDRANQLIRTESVRTPEAAYKAAADDVFGGSIVVGGSVIPPAFNRDGQTLPEVFGLPSQAPKNVVHEAVISYLNSPSPFDKTKSVGEYTWGDSWRKDWFWPIGEKADSARRAKGRQFPDGMTTTFNWDTKQLIIRIPTEIGGDRLTERSVVINANRVGELINQGILDR